MFRKNIERKVKKICPRYKKQALACRYSRIINKIEKFYLNNQKIYQDRKMYDLHWAFKDAQLKIHEYIEILLNDIREKYKECSIESKQIMTIRSIQKSAYDHEKNIKRLIRLYDIGSFFVTFIDIIISLILIVIITKVGHFGESLFDTGIVATLFISFVAFLKISLDRFYIIPKVHAWGWSLYKKINRIFEEDSAALIATYLSISALIKVHHEEELNKIVEKSENLFN